MLQPFPMSESVCSDPVEAKQELDGKFFRKGGSCDGESRIEQLSTQSRSRRRIPRQRVPRRCRGTEQPRSRERRLVRTRPRRKWTRYAVRPRARRDGTRRGVAERLAAVRIRGLRLPRIRIVAMVAGVAGIAGVGVAGGLPDGRLA